MRIKMLDTGRVIEKNDSYAARLIEQGKAVAVVQPEESPKKERTHGA